MSALAKNNRPQISIPNVEFILSEQYSLTNDQVREIKSLYSYDDKNFHVILREGEDFVLKITNWEDSQNRELIEQTTRLMEDLSASVPTQTPVRTTSGSLLGSYSYMEGTVERKCIVRLLTYIPGTTIERGTVTTEQSFQWGVLLAKMHKAVGDKKYAAILERSFLWTWEGLPQIMDYVSFITDSSDRALVTEVVQKHTDKMIPMLRTLPRGILHGDLNERNVLKNVDNEVYAIIDFGDCQGGPFIWDLAVLLVYLGISLANVEEDMLEYFSRAIAGYATIMPDVLKLSQLVETLQSLVCARFSQSLTLGLRSFSVTGDPYVMTTQKNGWPCLRKLHSLPVEEFALKLRSHVDISQE